MATFRNKSLRVLLLFNTIFVFAASLLGPLYAIFVKTIDGKILSISLSWSVFLLSATACMMIIRAWGDKIKEKKYLLMAGYLIRALVWFLFPFISTLAMLIGLQIILGVGEALGTPTFSALYAAHLDQGRSIEEFTDRNLTVNLSDAIGVLAGGLIVAQFGFASLFIIMGFLALISFFGIWFQPRELL